CNEDGTIWIVFNGEVYNHHDLRRELEAHGHVFRTHCDTEAIVHAYEQWGEKCVERFDGMFAFAIFDANTGDAFLARDRVGKKPLFWATFGNALHFASEIKAMRPSPAWNGEIDPDGLDSYLALGYVVAPRSIYRHVRKLEGGHWLRLRDGSVTIRRYWDVTRFDDDLRADGAVREDLDGRLARAVGARLESEVPLGAFLSGGIDSGLVVSYMSDAREERPTTVSVGFRQEDHNELDAAQRVAERYRTHHHAITLEPKLDGLLDRITGAFDEPFADASAIPTFFVCGAAREHVTVCLSGDGGDETFGGYDFRYVPHAVECRARRFVPGAPGRALLRSLGGIWPRSPRLPRFLRLATILANLGETDETAYYLDLCFLKPADTLRLRGHDPQGDPRLGTLWADVTDPYRRCPSDSPLQRAQYADLHIYMPNDPLVKVDRMSMQHSLEVRCPLLDHHVVEFAFRLPSATKMPHLAPKHLLRSLGRERLPLENIDLPKKGFTAPVSHWITGPFRDAFTADVLDAGAPLASHLDQAVLRRWFEDHCASRADRTYPLWAAWMFARWLRMESAAPVAPEPVGMPSA
ncbi:asparagine synthase (glutamine-hydrolyzing), partial [bacterium]|nr:asparagine synthase (glutamine-hydrolyzing) [bacterium]